jgi:hypothetical protein
MENSVDYFTRLRAAKLYSIQLWYYWWITRIWKVAVVS